MSGNVRRSPGKVSLRGSGIMLAAIQNAKSQPTLGGMSPHFPIMDGISVALGRCRLSLAIPHQADLQDDWLMLVGKWDEF